MSIIIHDHIPIFDILLADNQERMNISVSEMKTADNIVINVRHLVHCLFVTTLEVICILTRSSLNCNLHIFIEFHPLNFITVFIISIFIFNRQNHISIMFICVNIVFESSSQDESVPFRQLNVN